MKRLLRIFELSKNEQRVVLIIILTLITIAFVAYERRLAPRFQQTSAAESEPSPSPTESKDQQ